MYEKKNELVNNQNYYIYERIQLSKINLLMYIFRFTMYILHKYLVRELLKPQFNCHFAMSLSVLYDLDFQADRFAICSLYILGML